MGASTYIEKGWSLISLGDYEGAIQALNKALELSPGESRRSRCSDGRRWCTKITTTRWAPFAVLMKDPANALARINVGYICLKKKNFGEAVEHLSKAIRLDNDRKATLYAHCTSAWSTSSGKCSKSTDVLPENARARDPT